MLATQGATLNQPLRLSFGIRLGQFASPLYKCGDEMRVSLDRRRPTAADEPGYPVVTWVGLAGIFSPPILIDLGLLWTPSRAVVIFLLGPALSIVIRRQLSLCDFLALATAVWCVGAIMLNDGFRPYALVEILEFLGGYMFGRAFFFGPRSLQVFVRVFKVVVSSVIFLAVLDLLSGRRFTAEMFSTIFPMNVDLTEVQFRYNLVRATSTFPTAELYGTFCAVAAGIFLFSERTTVRKIIFSGIAVFGCVLSISSGPVLALAIVLAAFGYDRLLKQYPGRWRSFIKLVLAFVILFFVADVVFRGNELMHPLLILVRNLTFDPQTGYYRVDQWEHAMPIIMASPWVGNGFNFSVVAGDNMLLSVDNFFLVMAWRFGFPAVILFVLTMASASQSGRGPGAWGANSYMHDMRVGFSLAVWTFAMVGITVHLWDATWIFWSLCIGVRASLKQYFSEMKVHALNRSRLARLPS